MMYGPKAPAPDAILEDGEVETLEDDFDYYDYPDVHELYNDLEQEED